MNRTHCATLGLTLLAMLAACSERETTVSVNVRYWTNYLDPASFKVELEQQGRAPLNEAISPRQVEAGKYDVVCDHDWELDYCRFYERFDVSGWAERDTTVTFSGKTKAGKTIADDVAERGFPDRLSLVFELQPNEVNVVYFQLPNVAVASEPTSDAGAMSATGDAGSSMNGPPSDAGQGSGESDAGGIHTSDALPSDAAPTDAPTGDAASGDTASGDAASETGTSNTTDTVSLDTPDAGASDASRVDAAALDAAATDPVLDASEGAPDADASN